jgi:hypothetical protein
VSDPSYPTRGIAAGSSTATYELWAVLKPVLDRLAKADPTLIICLHVDDLSVTATDSDTERCTDRLVSAAMLVNHDISNTLQMQFASDKGYVIASTEQAARIIAAQLPMPTQAAHSVRRLGIDYSLASVGGRDQNHRKHNQTRWHRLVAALRNARKLPHLFPAGAPGIFVCGILPAALYGAEHYAPDPKHLNQLRTAAIKAWGPHPWGVPNDLAILLYPTLHDPLFVAVFQPIFRWAREVWLSSHPDPAHSDVLSAAELTAAAHRILQHDRIPLPQGPLLAMHSSLHFLKWRLAPPYGLADENGNPLDLSHGSPALLRHYVRNRFQAIQERCLEERFALRPNGAVQTPHWPFIRRFLASKRPNKRQKTSLLSILYGTLPTPAWLSTHGWNVSPHCEVCRQLCDLTHLIYGCHSPHNVDANELLGHSHIPPRLGIAPMRATVHGWEVPTDQFHFEQGIPVYTDGSAIHVQYPEIACSAAAAFQVDSQGKHRLLTVQNDLLGPQSSIAAEAIAVELATFGLRKSPTSCATTMLVADCQAVIDNLQSLPRALGYRHKYAGHFLDTADPHLTPIKIKSHMTEAVATQLGLRDHWFGNDKADRFANEARADTGKAGREYIDKQKTLFAHILKVTAAAADLPPVLTRPCRRTTDTLHEARRQPDPHAFARQGPRWICTQCGITARHSARKLSGCSQAARVVDRLHSTHRLFVAFREEQGLFTPFYFCNKCGAHSTSRVAALHSLCLPKLIPTPAMKRLEAGRHPRTNANLVSVRRFRLSTGVRARSPPPTASSSLQLKVSADHAPASFEDSDPEVEAARILGLGTAFDASD